MVKNVKNELVQMGNEKMWKKVYLMPIDKDGKLLREKPKLWNEIKSLDTFERIQIGARWLLLMNLNNQQSPQFGDCFGSYSSFILSPVWLHRILKTGSFH